MTISASWLICDIATTACTVTYPARVLKALLEPKTYDVMHFWLGTLKLIQRASAVTPCSTSFSCELPSSKQHSGSPWPGGLHFAVALALDPRIGWLQGTLWSAYSSANAPRGAPRSCALTRCTLPHKSPRFATACWAGSGAHSAHYCLQNSNTSYPLARHMCVETLWAQAMPMFRVEKKNLWRGACE